MCGLVACGLYRLYCGLYCVACGLYRRLGLAPAVYSDLRGPISREFSAAPVMFGGRGMRQQTDNGRWSPDDRGGLLIRPAKRHNAAGRPGRCKYRGANIGHPEPQMPVFLGATLL